MGDRIEQFLLSITPIGPSDRPEEKFWVRTERVPKGAPLAEEIVVWPLDHWIDQAQLLAGDPLVALLNPKDAASQSPLAFGQLLYGAVFQGRIRDSWLVSQGVAQSQQQLLQFRLGLKGDRLPRLPWEALSGDGRTLTTGTEVTFSRYRLQFGHQSAARDDINQLRFPRQLRILMAVSEPDDRDRLELAQEVERLQGELAKLKEADQPLEIVIDILPQPDRERLTQALEQGNYQVFHYAGHSTSGPDGGNLHLVSRRTGLAEMLSGQDLAGLLVNNGVLLAFFNSCQGSYTAAGASPASLLAQDKAAIDNLAAALVERGVPGVLAMSENIPDDVALTLMQLFYRNLRPDYSIDLSLSRVRQGLVSAYGSDRFYWALPILYLHRDFDGYLFRPAMATGSAIAFPSAIPKLENDEHISGDWDMPSDGGHQPTRRPWQDGDHPAPSPTPAPDPEPAHQAPSRLVGLDLPKFPQSFPFKSTPKPIAAPSADNAQPGIPGASGKSSPPPQRSPASQGNGSVRWIVGGLAIATLGAGGLLWNPGGDPDPNPPVSSASPAPQSPPQVTCTTEALQALDGVRTDNLRILGTGCINEGNTAGALTAMEALIDRNALQAAHQLLQVIPTDNQTARYYFLRGRLAWQAAKGQLSETLDLSSGDALRNWGWAVEREPESVIYRTALGFAYYQNSQFDQAQGQWTEVINLMAATANDSAQQVPLESRQEKERRRAELDARAGLALISYQKAQATSDAQAKETHLKNIQAQLGIINAADGTSFAPTTLNAKAWVWAPDALRLWPTLYAPANLIP